MEKDTNSQPISTGTSTNTSTLMPTVTATSTPLPTVTPRARPKPGDDLGFIKGMSYASWGESNYANPLGDRALEDLAKTGTNWVAIIANTEQKNAESSKIDILINSDASIIHAIQTAHSLNMNVMLKPQLDLYTDPEYVRQTIGARFNSEQWDKWFAAYTEMILHYAQLAEANGVEMFCIGTELNTAQKQTAHFQKLATDVRLVFSGPITYAASWNVSELAWWDSVDFIGVDAYFPLTEARAPSIDLLTTNWKPIVTDLEALSKKWNRPLIFTEIGYPAEEYAARNPASEENGALDPQTQANAYQAAFDVFRDKPWFGGMFWWMWEDTTFVGGMCDPHHTPNDKLAENVLRAEYGSLPVTLQGSAPLPVFDETKIVTYPIFTDAYDRNIEPGWSWSLSEKTVTEPVFAGQGALEINFQGWSGFSPHLQNVDTSQYQWLEFYIFPKENLSTTLIVNVADENDQVAYKQTITRCNYFDDKTGLLSNQWNRVLIPLEQIDADHRLISRIILAYWAANPTTIWIDEMRLVGSVE
jgi:hypothetical protein